MSAVRAKGGRLDMLTLSASSLLNVFPHPWQTFDVCDRAACRA